MKLKQICAFLLLGTLALTQSCATSQSRNSKTTSGNSEIYGPPAPFGPEPPGGALAVNPSAQAPHQIPGLPPASAPPGPSPTPVVTPGAYGPFPLQPRSVALVLGPGLARGFAYVGVLQALNAQKIPIGAVFGTEMGSLVGALYAMSNSINQFEWGLLRFKEDVFRNTNSFFSKFDSGPSEGDKLAAELSRVFGNKDLKDAKIPLEITIQAKDTGIPIILDHGSAVAAIRAALAVPSLFTPASWGGVKVISADASRPFLVTEAHHLGIGPVIVIDVLSDEEDKIAVKELKDADLVIKPDMSGIEYMDFQKRTDAAFRGKSAIIQHMPEIRRLVGLPENESDRRGVDP